MCVFFGCGSVVVISLQITLGKYLDRQTFFSQNQVILCAISSISIRSENYTGILTQNVPSETRNIYLNCIIKLKWEVYTMAQLDICAKDPKHPT